MSGAVLQLQDARFRQTVVSAGFEGNAGSFSVGRMMDTYPDLYRSAMNSATFLLMSSFVRSIKRLLRLAGQALAVLLPWPLKRLVLQKWRGYQLHRPPHIGWAWIYPRVLVMGEGSASTISPWPSTSSDWNWAIRPRSGAAIGSPVIRTRGGPAFPRSTGARAGAETWRARRHHQESSLRLHGPDRDRGLQHDCAVISPSS